MQPTPVWRASGTSCGGGWGGEGGEAMVPASLMMSVSA
jgi:hypothetical protein